jgi:hypothetical protein
MCLLRILLSVFSTLDNVNDHRLRPSTLLHFFSEPNQPGKSSERTTNQKLRNPIMRTDRNAILSYPFLGRMNLFYQVNLKRADD